jgi:aminoglycoside phosphotransferase (APT) family kinase protein
VVATADASVRRGRGPAPAVLTDPRIRAWLAGALDGQRVATARPLAGGYRNDNVLLVTDTAGQYVLRRYRGTDIRSARRTCGIEAALAARLRGVVPVAEVIAADPAGSAAGQPLLLSRYVPGVMVSDALAQQGEAAAGDLGRAAGMVRAAVGSVSFAGDGSFAGPDLIPSAAGMPAGLPEFVENCLRTAAVRNAQGGGAQASGALSPAEQDGLRELAARAGPLAGRAAPGRRLVHSDYNPKNLLATRQDGRWSVAAVLDWEFAFSGSPLTDIGNMLRPRPDAASGFTAGFVAGYREAGGELPAGWREISEALDLYALADFLTRPPEHRYFRQAVALIRARLGRG